MGAEQRRAHSAARQTPIRGLRSPAPSHPPHGGHRDTGRSHIQSPGWWQRRSWRNKRCDLGSRNTCHFPSPRQCPPAATGGRQEAVPTPGDLSQPALCAHTPTRCARTHAFTLVFTLACQTGPGTLHPISHSGGEGLWTPGGMGGCRSQDRPYRSPDPRCPAPLGSQVSNTWGGSIGSQKCHLLVHSPDLIPHLRRTCTCQIQESSEPREVSPSPQGTPRDSW